MSSSWLPAQLPAVAVLAGGKQPSKVVAELLPTRL